MRAGESAPLGTPALTETAWLADGIERRARFRLAPESTLAWLDRYTRPWENHVPEWRTLLRGRYGPRRAVFELVWPARARDAGDRESVAFEPDASAWLSLRRPALEALDASLRRALALALPTPEPALLPVTRARGCPRWRAPRPVTVLRYAGERERLALFDCDGAIAPDVIDRLSALARPPHAERPALPLPEEPLAGAPAGEWTPGVRLLEPRLVWLLGKIAAAFPNRAIVIQSGYRPDSHSSLHRSGRALDLAVEGVANEDVFRYCRRLPDVGCGYYPHNRFVHVDVRPWGSPPIVWVDTAEPGEPSRYADGWPGVVEPRTAWIGTPR